jgi:hypothetical protein
VKPRIRYAYKSSDKDTENNCTSFFSKPVNAATNRESRQVNDLLENMLFELEATMTDLDVADIVTRN